MASMGPVNGIMGPVGSGKTSCLMMKTIRLAQMQPRSKLDGVRYTKALFVRETFRQLYGTTIPSWWAWMPKEVGVWRGAENQPGFHHIKFQLGDQSIVDLQIMFEALGEQNVEALFRGKEFNILNLNEADTLVSDVLDQGFLRVMQGRYPGERHVNPEDCIRQVNVDYNAPDIENYLYKIFEEDRPEGYRFFRQPGGLDPRAENRQRASRESYEMMRKAMIGRGRADLARRMIDNQYGFSRDGQPVYEEYRDDFHCSDEPLLPVPGLAVYVDFDQGLRPACVLRQNMPNGQMRVLDEIYSDGGGAQGLCDALRRLIGSEKYAGFRVVGGRCDPAANARDANDAESWIDCVNRLMGWQGAQRVRVADTNSVERRHEAVRFRLKTSVGDGQPGILISSTCRVLRKGFAANYRYKRKKASKDYEDAPEKKFPVADVHDALQYGALDEGGYAEVVGRAARAQSSFGSKMIVANVGVKV